MAAAQPVYWVFLTDKSGTQFDPYAYFDSHAVARYRQSGADLHDISNYPVSEAYEAAVGEIATETVGSSRWLNAVGVVATPEQAAAIARLPFVARVQAIESEGMQLAEAGIREEGEDGEFSLTDKDTVAGPLEAQLVRMGGQLFRANGIDGRGLRIAVFDGGFPRVNTHEAFKHLRDSNRIVATWNFCNRKENVYGWNSHGTMTLSCIGGRIGGKDLGLATGAEYLLARTEVASEPAKEEVWWQMAVEWADKHGANIISSSLGYGKERHYTKDMDGTSYVARAGNMAARKGMLVCNSAGNEADDRQWQTIITPSDADSVLCVGGIENSLSKYHHIGFSSYGPSADGRLKPNVCAFGYARTADVPNDRATHYVHGTSFSCPLVAGFAACAWQTMPGKPVMELFREIERSGDLYPYYDYAFGYGVPQAAHFTGGDTGEPVATFRFETTSDSVKIVPTRALTHTKLFYHLRRPADGQLAYYANYDITYIGPEEYFAISKAAVYNRTLVARLGGYVDSLRLEQSDYAAYEGMKGISYSLKKSGGVVASKQSGLHSKPKPSRWGSAAEWNADFRFALGLPVKTMGEELPMLAWSPATRVGVSVLRAFGKVYSVGLGLEWGAARYNYKGMQSNELERQLGADMVVAGMEKEDYRRTQVGEIGLELFQRVRLVALGVMGKGLHWDLGVYGSYGYSSYQLSGRLGSGSAAADETIRFGSPETLSDYRWNYGVVSRLTYDIVGVYGRFRLNGIGGEPAAGKVMMPRLEIGVLLAF